MLAILKFVWGIIMILIMPLSWILYVQETWMIVKRWAARYKQKLR